MLIYTGTIYGTRTVNYDGKQAHYLQLTSDQPASGSPFGDEFKLPPNIPSLEAFRKGEQVEIMVHLFAGNNKRGAAQLYMSVLPFPDGSVYRQVEETRD